MLRILICDDHPLFRRGVKDLIADAFAPIEVGEAESSQEALILAKERKWDIAVVDIMMPGRSGPELVEELKQLRPSLPILVMSTCAEEHYAVRMFRAGVSGYLNKARAAHELIEAIKKILTGHKYVSAPVGERFACQIGGDNDTLPHEKLSDREHQVLCLLASGKGLKEIADELCVSANTVSTYRSRILDKMNLKNNAELTHYAIRHSLVNYEP
ncbi:MAG: response regulator [Nitrospiraceae bacterium]